MDWNFTKKICQKIVQHYIEPNFLYKQELYLPEKKALISQGFNITVSSENVNFSEKLKNICQL